MEGRREVRTMPVERSDAEASFAGFIVRGPVPLSGSPGADDGSDPHAPGAIAVEARLAAWLSKVDR